MSDDLDRLFERIASGDPASRREFMRRLGATGVTVSGASTFLAACGGIKSESQKKPSATATAVSHPKTAITQVNFSNWPLYIDKHTIKDFEKKYGGHVKYTEDINDNEEFFGK